MNAPTRLRASWYLLALVPITIGTLLAIKLVFAMLDDVERMDRVIVPGERVLDLPPGEYVLYAETSSVVDGVSYQATSFRLSCAMFDAAGDEVALESPNGSTKYTMGGYSGQSMAEVVIPARGEYRLTCTGGPAVVAIGQGVGTRIVSLVVTLFGTIGLTVLAVILVRRRRRKPPIVIWPQMP